jgi:HK97 family phage major capsid protein
MPDLDVKQIETALAAIKDDSQKAWDEMRNALEDQKGLSDSAKAEAKEITDAMQTKLNSFEEKQKELHASLTRMASNASSAKGLDAAGKEVKQALDALGIKQSLIFGEKSEEMTAYSEDFFRRVAQKGAGGLYSQQDALIDKKGIIVSDLSSAGYYVPPAEQGRIISKMYETSPMLQYAEVTTLTAGNTVEHIVDRDEFGFKWVDEQENGNDDDSNQALKLLKIEAFEGMIKVPVSRRTLQDANIDFASYVANKAGDRLGRGFNRSFVVGNGATQPQGFLNAPRSADGDDSRAFGTLQEFTTGNASGFAAGTSDKMVDMVMSLKSQYEAGSNWFMNKFTLGEVRKLKDGDGNYLWQPDFTRLASSTLLGYGVARFEDMPSLAANSASLAFGDMRQAYHVANRMGLMTVVDEVSDDRFVIYKFYQRMGGSVTDTEALRVMKTSA